MPGTPQGLVCRMFEVCGATVSDLRCGGKVDTGLRVSLGNALVDHQRQEGLIH